MSTSATEQPPYPCAHPLPVLHLSPSTATTGSGRLLAPADAARVESILDGTFAAVQDLLLDRPARLQALPSATSGPDHYRWRRVAFTDSHEKANHQCLAPSGSGCGGPTAFSPAAVARLPCEKELLLEALPHLSGFHPTRVALTLTGITPEEFLNGVHCPGEEQRKRYTPSMASYVRWCTNPNLPEFGLPDGSGTTTTTAAAKEGSDRCGDYGAYENERLPALALAREQALLSGDATSDRLSSLRTWYLESNVFTAPPPVSCREAFMAVEKAYCREEQCYYIWGCSVATDEHPSLAVRRMAEGGGSGTTAKAYNNNSGRDDAVLFPTSIPAGDYGKCIQVTHMFGWRAEAVVDPTTGECLATAATLVSITNPGGWTPSFLLSLFKSEVGREIAAIRRTLYADMREQRLRRGKGWRAATADYGHRRSSREDEKRAKKRQAAAAAGSNGVPREGAVLEWLDDAVHHHSVSSDAGLSISGTVATTAAVSDADSTCGEDTMRVVCRGAQGFHGVDPLRRHSLLTEDSRVPAGLMDEEIPSFFR